MPQPTPFLASRFSPLAPPPAALPYNPALSLWLSVDPLSDKYPNLSPYVYCANNPVRLVDKDGREIVDRDGNVCYTQKDGWLPNAPEDTKRIGDAMMETEVGREQFNSLVNSDTKVQLRINSSDCPDKYGDMEPLNPKMDSYGNITLGNAIITIYERSISNYLDEALPDNISEDNSPMGRTACLAAPTIDQYIGAVCCHETEHLTPENLKLNHQRAIETNPDVKKSLDYNLEREPERKKYMFLQQLAK